MLQNVRQILTNLGTLLDHDPQTIDTHESRLAMVGRRYEDINVGHDWLNLQKEVDWYVFANRTETTTGLTVSVTHATHEIIFSGALGMSLTVASDFLYNAGGMTFVDANGDAYTIARFTSTTTALLTAAYTGLTNATMDTWTIKGERFYLPVDCTRAQAFLSPDNAVGRMQIIDRRTREFVFGWQPPADGTVYWMADDDEVYDLPPDPGFSAADAPGAGSLTPNGIYEVCYTLESQGRESPPSVTVRVEMSSAALHSITLQGLQDTSDSGLATGIYKNLYVRLLTKNGVPFYSRWLFVAQLTELSTTYTIAAFPAANATELYFASGRKYMRTEWVPGSDATLRLRYLRNPKRLVADSDTPEWPPAFHDLLVYGAAVELGSQQSQGGDKINRWQKLYETLLQRYMAAKINVPDAPTRKRARQIGGTPQQPYYTNGPVTGDFSG